MLDLTSSQEKFYLFSGIAIVVIIWLFYAILRFLDNRNAKFVIFGLLGGLLVVGILLGLWGDSFPRGGGGIENLSSTRSIVHLWAFTAFGLFGVLVVVEVFLLIFTAIAGVIKVSKNN